MDSRESMPGNADVYECERKMESHCLFFSNINADISSDRIVITTVFPLSVFMAHIYNRFQKRRFLIPVYVLGNYFIDSKSINYVLAFFSCFKVIIYIVNIIKQHFITLAGQAFM